MLTPDGSSHKDFFISYHSADRLWAEWIAWQLEQAGYSVVLQNWNSQPEQSFTQSMQEALSTTRFTIAVLSPDYLDDLTKETAWTRAFISDPKSEQGALLPVQVRECHQQLKGWASLITYIDLVGRDENEALEVLLVGVQRVCDKSEHSTILQHTITEQPRFPASFPAIENLPPRNQFFTDRESILQQIHAFFSAMNQRNITRPQAIKRTDDKLPEYSRATRSATKG